MKRLNKEERKQLWICIERLQDVFIRLEHIRDILEKKGFVYTYEDKEPFRNAMVHIKEMQIILEEKNTLAEKIERGESEDFDPLDNSVCPFPEREYCEGCGNYIEEEGICAKELAI